MSSESGIEQEEKYCQAAQEDRLWLFAAVAISIGIWGVIIYLLMGVSNETQNISKAGKNSTQTVNSKSSR